MSATLEMYLASRSYAPASERQRRSILVHFEEMCGAGTEVTAEELMLWWKDRAQLKPSSRRAALISVRGYLDWLRKAGQRSDNPAELVRAPTVHFDPPKALTPAQIDALRAVLDTPTKRLRIGLMLDAGLRVGEVVRLESGDLEGNALTVHGKGGKVAVIPLPEYLCDLWPSEPGRLVPITVNGLRVYTYNCLRKAGIEGHSPHSLRRTFATEAVRRGVQPHVLAAILRHSSIATSSHYVRVSLDDMAEAL